MNDGNGSSDTSGRACLQPIDAGAQRDFRGGRRLVEIGEVERDLHPRPHASTRSMR